MSTAVMAVHNPCHGYRDKGVPMSEDTGTDAPGPPDPEADWWTIAEVAAYLGVRESTVIVYRNRGKKGLASGLPPEDHKFGATPVYKPTTIINWKRPGQGTGGGRPRKDDTA